MAVQSQKDKYSKQEYEANMLIFGYINHVMNKYESLIIPNEINLLTLLFYLLDIESQMILS